MKFSSINFPLLSVFALFVHCANAEGSQTTVFKCVQYEMNTQLSSLDVAKSCLADSSKWKSPPVTNTCTAIAFMDDCTTLSEFPKTAFPGNATTSDAKDDFVVVITGAINISEDGPWTFGCGTDDGYELTLRGVDGTTYTSSQAAPRSGKYTFTTFNLSAGVYALEMIYYERAQGAVCVLCAASGSYTSFNSSTFALVGDDLCAVKMAPPGVYGVTAKQRYPWNGKVDITYIAADSSAAQGSVDVSIVATNRVTGAGYAATPGALSGDICPGSGMHHVVWDLNKQGIEFKSDDVVFTVSIAYATSLLSQYCIVDLSSGANAASYPVSYIAVPPIGGFNTDEYKTTKLVLRLIQQGSFKMGGEQNVTLTKPFYCGIFEMTQKQYELVMGSNPSFYKGDMRPVEYVSYNTIRGSSNGAKWPSSSAVDSTSFMGKLRSRTRLDFDLPTEAQWEYACRAGTTSDYNNGGSSENDLKLVGRYNGNTSDGKGGYSQHTTVGSYAPNSWGLYDMHGNIGEFCLDWSGDLSYGTDPKGPSSGSSRTRRGATWGDPAAPCTSSARGERPPSGSYPHDGFRLARTLTDAEIAGYAAQGENVKYTANSVPVAIDSRTNVSNRRTEAVPWDASWIGGDSGATVVIYDNDNEVTRSTGVGELSLDVGRHELLYRTYIANVAQSERYSAVVYKCNCAYALGDIPLVETKSAKSETCSEDGWTHEVKCGRCNTILEVSTIRPGGHVRVETKAAKAATCTEDGWTHEVKCSRCNEVFEASTMMPKLGHVEVVTKPAVEPDISTVGLTAEISCSRCGVVLQAQVPIPPKVRNVTAKQRYPWNGLVDITCTIAGINGMTNGLVFAMAAVMPDSGEVHDLSHFWVVRNGENSTDVEVRTNGNYRLVWYAHSDLGQVRYTNIAVRVTLNGHPKVQLWEGGPYWATTNIGAKEPWESGYYFWWGDTVGYKRENSAWVATDGSSSNFSFTSANTPTYNINAATLQSAGWVVSNNGTYVLAPEHDAAHVHWGGGWRMPTYQELDDLSSKCVWTWTTTNGVNGYIVRGSGGYASNSIFLPCAGGGLGTSLYDAGSYGPYWSSVPKSNYYSSWNLDFRASRHYTTNYDRYYGQSVRPVQGFTK